MRVGTRRMRFKQRFGCAEAACKICLTRTLSVNPGLQAGLLRYLSDAPEGYRVNILKGQGIVSCHGVGERDGGGSLK